MGRAPCCDKANVKKGPWSPEEDSKLKGYIDKHGTGGNWMALPQKVGLKRCGKSCRLRWANYLRPNIKHGGFSKEEDNIIYNLYMSIGSRWSMIAAQLPGRTDNDIKNYWNTKLKKKQKDYQTCRDLAAAEQESKDMQSYVTSPANTNPNIFGPQKQPRGVGQHTNIDMDGPRSNFGAGIISQPFDQNCGATITNSSSSSEPAAFQLNPQEVNGHNSRLRKLLDQGGILVDTCSKNNMSMISTRSPIQASNCINSSQIHYPAAHNQYKSDAASQNSYETSATPVLLYARNMENYIKLEKPSAALIQNANSLFSYASRFPDQGGNNESVWTNTSNDVENGSYGFSRELDDLLLYNNDSPVQQREPGNDGCGSNSIY